MNTARLHRSMIAFVEPKSIPRVSDGADRLLSNLVWGAVPGASQIADGLGADEIAYYVRGDYVWPTDPIGKNDLSVETVAYVVQGRAGEAAVAAARIAAGAVGMRSTLRRRRQPSMRPLERAQFVNGTTRAARRYLLW